jgi:hypothetical protein
MRFCRLCRDELHFHAHLGLHQIMSITLDEAFSRYRMPTWNPSILRCRDSQSSYRHCEGFHRFCKASRVCFSSSLSISLSPTSPRAWRMKMLSKRVVKSTSPSGVVATSCVGVPSPWGDESRDVSSFASHCDGALNVMVIGIKSARATFWNGRNTLSSKDLILPWAS